jgi:hypothetical protein
VPRRISGSTAKPTSPPPPSDLTDQALIAAGWQQVVAQFDAGVTRQHRH